jgi:hypothetical protein
MTRFKAAFTHLIISAVLASMVIGLIVVGWYPLPLFWVIGGPMLIALIVGIDVVLGPAMTLLLFNPKKSRCELTLDLSLIGLVQLGALIYGLHSGYVGRASYGAFYEGQFHLIYAADLAPKFVAEAELPQFQRVPWIGQQYLGVRVPDTARNKSDLAFYGALGAGPERFPKFYVPLTELKDDIEHASLGREQLQHNNPTLPSKLDALLSKQKLTWQDIAVVPFDLRTTTYTAIVNKQDSRVLTVLRDNPLRVEQR